MLFNEIVPTEVPRLSKPLYAIEEYPIQANSVYTILESYKRFKDNNGLDLNGVYARAYKSKVEVLIINSGVLNVRYKFPRLNEMYNHPMLNWYNQLHAFGTKEDEIQRVIDGKKPVGFSLVLRENLSETINTIEASGLPYTIIEDISPHLKDMYVEVAICQNGRVEDHFDMADIVKHYVRMNVAEGGSNTYVYETFGDTAYIMHKYELKRWIEGWWDYANPKNVQDIFLTGILLGYPLEATYAYMMGDIK